MDYRKILFDNWSIKLISLVLAVILWFNVTSKGKMEIALTVPLELQNIPAGMAVVGDVPGFLDVRVQAQERVLRDITMEKQVTGRLDLSRSRVGENTVRISPDDINRPSAVMVTHISPYEIKVRLEQLVRKTVKLKPVLHGSPASGHRVVRVEARPAKIAVEGPAGVVQPLAVLQTVPIDIGDASSSFTLEPKIDYEGRPVKLLDKDISIHIVIERAQK